MIFLSTIVVILILGTYFVTVNILCLIGYSLIDGSNLSINFGKFFNKN